MTFKTITFSFLCVFGIFLIKGKKESFKDFSIRKITSDYSPLNVVASNSVIDSILDQPFTYIGKGRQSFVFLSEDKKYVLKFVRQDRLKVPLFSKDPFFSNAISLQKSEKRASWEKSYLLAYEKAKNDLDSFEIA